MQNRQRNFARWARRPLISNTLNNRRTMRLLLNNSSHNPRHQILLHKAMVEAIIRHHRLLQADLLVHRPAINLADLMDHHQAMHRAHSKAHMDHLQDTAAIHHLRRHREVIAAAAGMMAQVAGSRAIASLGVVTTRGISGIWMTRKIQ